MHKEMNYGSKRIIEEFCEYFEIPYMTETDWELGNRRVPTYLLRLMEYKIRIEQLADKKNQASNGIL